MSIESGKGKFIEELSEPLFAHIRNSMTVDFFGFVTLSCIVCINDDSDRYSLTHSLTLTYLLTHSLTHSLLLTHSLTYSLAHPPTHSLTHLLTYSYLLTYSLTHD